MPPKKKEFFTGHWYPMYASRILNSQRVEDMTLAEEGAYRRAIDLLWMHGSLPADPKKLADKIGKQCTLKIAVKVRQMCSLMRSNHARIVSNTLEKIREEQRIIAESRVRGGQVTARKRWGNKGDSGNDEDPESDSSATSPATSSPNSSAVGKKSKEDLKEKEKKYFSLYSRAADAVAHEKKGEDIGSAFLKILRQEPEFSHVDFDHELDKATTWHAKRNRKVTPKNFFNWITRIDPPIQSKSHAAGGTRNGTGPRDFYAEREQRELEDRAKIDKIRREVEEEDRRKLSEKSRPDRR